MMEKMKKTKKKRNRNIEKKFPSEKICRFITSRFAESSEFQESNRSKVDEI